MRKFIFLLTTICSLSFIGCSNNDSNNLIITPAPLTNDVIENIMIGNDVFNNEDDIVIDVLENNVEGVENFLAYKDDTIKENNMVVDNNVSNFGVSFAIENASSTGLTIVCTQKDGEDLGELTTGSYYIVQRLENGEWVDVPYVDEVGGFCWTMEAWVIPLNDNIHWDVDWSLLYGELPSGEYRIGKEVSNFKEVGDFEETIIYANFKI